MEIEVKYIINADIDLIESKLLQYYPDLRYLGEFELPAIYYDTFDGSLEKHESVLRVREENGFLIGCYKARASADRVFIEEELTLSKEDIEKTWYKKLKNYNKINQIIKDKEICPVVKINTLRKVYLFENSQITLEIAIDRVIYHDGLARENRLEIELKEGELSSFETFVEDFHSRFSELEETNNSKYQQAKKILNKHV